MSSEEVAVAVRPGAYHDSVTLMRVGRALLERPGVLAAQTAMGTLLNLELLADAGFDVPAGTGANDLVIALRAASPGALADAQAALDTLLAPSAPPAAAEEEPPRTTSAAARRGPATLALVSVPGEHAFTEAMDALTSGLNVMVFSDNVSLDQEIALKEEAARRGLIVMGPDCGTAVVGGAGLGFANAVRPGPVGLVAASGTGSQQVMCLLDAAGVGVSHVLGVGGRDLSAEVSARSTLQALTALDEDPATSLIVVVSKPPAAQVAGLIREAARRLSTPTVFALLGPGQPDLTAAVETVLERLSVPVPEWAVLPAPAARTVRPGGRLRGLFVGGTLCDEAMQIACGALGPIHSNIPLDPTWTLNGGSHHTMIDFGDDALTRGRAHPMIDPALRLERLALEASDPSCGVLLLDVVLGYGAEPDPAALLAPVIGAVPSCIPVVVSLCGTAADPQDRDRQALALQRAGASVFASNAAAARHAVALLGSTQEAQA